MDIWYSINVLQEDLVREYKCFQWKSPRENVFYDSIYKSKKKICIDSKYISILPDRDREEEG